MKIHLPVFIMILLLAALACQSASTPIPPAVSLEDQVLTAAAGIALTQNLQPTTQPQAIIDPTQTSIPVLTPEQEILGTVGGTVTQNGYILTLVSLESATQYGDFAIAQPGNKFIALDLLFESTVPSGVHINSFYATLKDSNGYVYNYSVFGKDPALQLQSDMPAGEKMRGWLTFEIPQSAIGLTFIYEPIDFSNTRIRFDLGQ